MFEALARLWGSRKTWQITAGTVTNVAAQMITVYALANHWAPAHTDAAVQFAGNLIGICAQVAGLVAAALTAWEDYARKVGVTTPPPSETDGAAAVTNPRPAGEV